MELSLVSIRFTLVALMMVGIFTAPAMAALNDTGAGMCFDGFSMVGCHEINSGVDAAYPFQDGRVGRDALAAVNQLEKIGSGAAGFDFTPLDASGDPIPLNDQGLPISEPVCVQDNVTGLLWQAASQTGTYAQATALAEAADLCGVRNGWRLPTRFELLSIVHHGASSPAIDTDFFPHTSNGNYWSGTVSISDSDRRWTVSFASGMTWTESVAGVENLRLVNGEQLGLGPLQENEGIIQDNQTGLMWGKCSLGQNNDAGCTGTAHYYSWQDALKAAVAANAQNYLGYSDWRLPNRTELESLKGTGTTIDGSFFPNTNVFYWSSTPGWAVNFSGFTYNENHPAHYNDAVRLVRGGAGQAAHVPHPFAAGEGTIDNPYQIATVQQLDAVRNYLDKHFILIADIDLDVTPHNQGEAWEPIGDESAPFTGSLDGGGFQIFHLVINRPDLDGVGLFGATGPGVGGWLATIENLELHAGVIGRSYVGPLVGDAREGVVVRNAHVFGSVHATQGRTGGLVGRAWGDSLIENVATDCTVTAAISRAGGIAGELEGRGQILDSRALGDVFVRDAGEPGNYVGGLVGETEDDAQIHRSWASGRVTGALYVGGLVGRAENNTLIAESYATGEVEGAGDVGGLVGDLRSDIDQSFATGRVIGEWRLGGLVGFARSDARIAESYATGTVTGSHSAVGGLIGRLDGRVFSSFATGDVTGNGTVGGLVGDLWREDALIEASYATGTVNGVSYVGGLVGDAYESTIIDSYGVGPVSGDSDVGGLVGNPTGATIINSYWAIDTSGQESSNGGVGVYYDALKAGATFTDWDFDATWKLIEGATTPYLHWQRYFTFKGTQVQIVEDEGEVKAGYLLTPVGDVPSPTCVQSTVADESMAGIEGLQGRWMAVTRAGSSEARGVAATDADGESRTWFEIYNAHAEAWEKASSTLALEGDAFEAGNEILIEEDAAEGLQIRIETQVTRELHF